jgi:hypothetical protein
MVSYWILKNRHGQSRYKIGLAYKKKTNDFSCFEN